MVTVGEGTLTVYGLFLYFLWPGVGWVQCRVYARVGRGVGWGQQASRVAGKHVVLVWYLVEHLRWRLPALRQAGPRGCSGPRLLLKIVRASRPLCADARRIHVESR